MDAPTIEKLFEVQPVKNQRQLERKGELRMAARNFARTIGKLTNHSAARTTAIYKVHEAMVMAIAAIEIGDK